MGKDPAALFYIDKWLVATKEMKAGCRGWYLNLILHQFDKGDLPNDIEELANLADVRISEFKEFEQVFEQTLKHKFEENENGRLENQFAKEIMQARETFKNKRSFAGKLSYVLRYYRENHKPKKALERFIKENIDLDFDVKNKQVLEQVFKQISELYINVNKDISLEEEGEPKPEKIKFADLVTMKEEEHEKLIKQFGKEATEWMIKKLDNYKGAKGKQYKCDYRAILSWVVDEYNKQSGKPTIGEQPLKYNSSIFNK